MTDDFNPSSTPGVVAVAAEPTAAAARKPAQPKRCAHCGGPFGLVRHRRIGMQFCSAVCTNLQAEAFKKAIGAKARCYELLNRAVSS